MRGSRNRFYCRYGYPFEFHRRTIKPEDTRPVYKRRDKRNVCVEKKCIGFFEHSHTIVCAVNIILYLCCILCGMNDA